MGGHWGNQKKRPTQTHKDYIVKRSQTNKLPQTNRQTQSTRGEWEGTKHKRQTQTRRNYIVKLSYFHKQANKHKVPEESGMEPKENTN